MEGITADILYVLLIKIDVQFSTDAENIFSTVSQLLIKLNALLRLNNIRK